jgi:hypothetical protein
MSGGTLVQNTAERTDIAHNTAVASAGSNTGGAAGTQLGYVAGAVTSKAYFDTTNPYAGTRSYRIDLISAETCYLQLAGTAAATSRARWYMRFESLPTVSEWVATVRSASANSCHFKVTTAGRLETINASGAQITLGASTLPTATWIWVETRVTPGTTTTGVIEVSWGTAGNAATETFATVSNANLGTAQIASVRVGRTQAVSATNSLKYDEIAYEANPTGPIGPVSVGSTLTFDAADTLGATDATNVTAESGPASTDPVGLTDSVVASIVRTDTRADTLGLTDAVSTVRGFAPTVTDTTGLTDTAAVTLSTTRTPTDTTALTDTVTASLTASRTPVDLAGLTDTVTATQATTRAPADPAGILDTVTTATTTSRGATDTATLTDAVIAELVQLVAGSAADTLGLVDAATRTAAATRAPTDTTGLSDAVTVVVSRTVTVGDGLGLTDAPSRTLTLERTTADTLTVSDTAATISAWEVELGDTLGVVDAVFPVRSNPEDLPPDPGDLVVGWPGRGRGTFTVQHPRKAP